MGSHEQTPAQIKMIIQSVQLEESSEVTYLKIQSN